ncbi:hypothetical protein [Stenotrophomonas maltophilia]|uniref:hypothetical protein n=1 Tax=Stenotrophomonas maltophilia TaxID=40324 RepID=UPI0013DA3515|nr:hypothetical protein [Stenotrophomonas maltophilia]
MKISAQTIVLPCGDDATNHDPDNARQFTGFVIGTLFCHHAISDDESLLLADHGQAEYGDWGITHLPSGASIQRAIPSHYRAIWLSRQLLAMQGMDGTSAAEIRAAVADRMGEINALRFDAMNGDCQGQCQMRFDLTAAQVAAP